MAGSRMSATDSEGIKFVLYYTNSNADHQKHGKCDKLELNSEIRNFYSCVACQRIELLYSKDAFLAFIIFGDDVYVAHVSLASFTAYFNVVVERV